MRESEKEAMCSLLQKEMGGSTFQINKVRMVSFHGNTSVATVFKESTTHGLEARTNLRHGST